MNDLKADRSGETNRLFQPPLGLPRTRRYRFTRAGRNMRMEHDSPSGTGRSVPFSIRAVADLVPAVMNALSNAVFVLAALKELDRLCWHDRRDRVLVHQLGVSVPAQQQREIIEPGDDTLKFHPIDQEDGDGGLVLLMLFRKTS